MFCVGIFEFDVENHRFPVHKHLLSNASPALAALVDNGMQETDEEFVRLTDADTKTFARLVEFIYTGDYTVPQPEPTRGAKVDTQNYQTDEPEESSHDSYDWEQPCAEAPAADMEEPMVDSLPEQLPEPSPAEESDPWATWRRSKKGNDKKKKRQQTLYAPAQESKLSPRLPDLDIRVTVNSPVVACSTINRNMKGLHDYTEVFFCHAQSYILAEKYGLEELKALSSERLYRAFRHYESAERPSSAIPDLIRYVFEHTPERVSSEIERPLNEAPHIPHVDTLQNVCVHFAANNSHLLRLTSESRLLLREGGFFVELFVARLAERFARM